MKRYVVTGTSMVVEADTPGEAVDRAQDSSGWHWEAVEVKDVATIRARLLAYAIGEWTAALAHLDVLARHGDDLAADLSRSVRSEREDLCSAWHLLRAPGSEFRPAMIPTIVAEARAFATQHQAEIDSLLETGVST